MIPLLLLTVVERFAFKHTHFEPSTAVSSVLFALIIFTVTCGVIITVCYLFEKPDEITIKFAEQRNEEPESYYEEWKDDPPFIVMYLIYGLICIIALFLLYDAAIKGENYMLYFRNYSLVLVVVDLVIIGIMRYKIAPSIPQAIMGMIHFETSYMLRAVGILVLIWGLMYYFVKIPTCKRCMKVV